MLIVLGSINEDHVVNVARAPGPGETLFATGYARYPGGKGANQAVAAARLGGRVRFWGMVGCDASGEAMKAALAESGVDIGSVENTPDYPTGTALITVEADGENRIVVAQGANFAIDRYYIARHRDELQPGSLLLCQNEVPQPAIHTAFELAHAMGVRTVLNPAPFVELDEGLLGYTDILIPNQSEAEALIDEPVHDRDWALAAAEKLLRMGPGVVIITLGDAGLCIHDGHNPVLLPAYKVPVVDTTAAGDCFVGAFCACLMQGMTLTEAAGLGQLAAAYAVGRPGAQPSMPSKGDLSRFAKSIGATYIQPESLS